MEHISAIISAIVAAICTITTAWFAYNQYSKDKFTDAKIEKFKQDEMLKNKRRNDCSAIVYGELWNILYELGADRVYILQPHPLGDESMLSIYYEVKRKGVEGMRDKIQNLKMSEVAKFSADMNKNLFLFITDIGAQVTDKYARSMLSSCGCVSAIVKRLNDNRYDWVGSIFCEFTRAMPVTETEARSVLHDAAMNIQYLLPEYKA